VVQGLPARQGRRSCALIAAGRGDVPLNSDQVAVRELSLAADRSCGQWVASETAAVGPHLVFPGPKPSLCTAT
jgi:hypothetical protein